MTELIREGKLFHQAVVGARREDVAGLAVRLGVDLSAGCRVSKSNSQALWSKLSYYGSNDFAYIMRGFGGVGYPEIVRDVCKKLKLTHAVGDSSRAVRENEQRLLAKIFEDAWAMMTPKERRELLRDCNFKERNIPKNGAATTATVFSAKAAGFSSYKIAVIVANWLSRAVLGHGLAFSTNAMLTRSMGVALGPPGMILSGGWLLKGVADPAMRKTMPAVAMVAALRQLRAESD
jgi:uncharacterized protein YaaW (UPF0174 family)